MLLSFYVAGHYLMRMFMKKVWSLQFLLKLGRFLTS
jgi:hypothetical protein